MGSVRLGLCKREGVLQSCSTDSILETDAIITFVLSRYRLKLPQSLSLDHLGFIMIGFHFIRCHKDSFNCFLALHEFG